MIFPQRKNELNDKLLEILIHQKSRLNYWVLDLLDRHVDVRLHRNFQKDLNQMFTVKGYFVAANTLRFVRPLHDIHSINWILFIDFPKISSKAFVLQTGHLIHP